MENFEKSNSMFLMFSWKLKKTYEDAFGDLVDKYNLTRNEIDVLLFLRNNHPMDTAKDIAKYRAMSKSMISKSVDSLYQRKYLDYKASDIDKRLTHLQITELAAPVVEILSQRQLHFFSKLTKDIDEEAQKVMQDALNQMYKNILTIHED